MPSLSEIFAVFFKIGLLTFGGGGVMIAWIQQELVRKKHWLSDSDFLDFYAIAQCTPGIIAINVATMVGYAVCRKAGATIATVAVILPSIIIISLIASVLPNFAQNDIVMHAFNGVRAAVVAIITNIAVNMLLQNVKSITGKAIFALSFLLLLLFALSPITMVIFGCIAGLTAKKILPAEKDKV
jgi:chromate transporter